jgi:hypothetical protein
LGTFLTNKSLEEYMKYIQVEIIERIDKRLGWKVKNYHVRDIRAQMQRITLMETKFKSKIAKGKK